MASPDRSRGRPCRTPWTRGGGTLGGTGRESVQYRIPGGLSSGYNCVCPMTTGLLLSPELSDNVLQHIKHGGTDGAKLRLHLDDSVKARLRKQTPGEQAVFVVFVKL